MLPSVDDVLRLDPAQARALRPQLAALMEAAHIASETPTAAAAPTPTGEWLTTDEVAAFLKYSPRQVRRFRRDGTWQRGTHFVQRGRGKLLYHRPSIEAWMRTLPPRTTDHGLAFGADVPPGRRRLTKVRNKVTSASCPGWVAPASSRTASG